MKLQIVALSLLVAIAALAQPPNDLCSSAQLITVGATLTSTNASATTDSPGFCAISPPLYGVWFSIIGDGTLIEISTCSMETDINAAIQIFTGTCDNLVCVGGNAGGYCAVIGDAGPIASWCSVAGVEYFIHIGSQSATTGNIWIHTRSLGFCPVPGQGNCIDHFEVTAPATVNGNTCYSDDCCDGDGRDEYIVVNIPNDGRWTFSLCGSSDYFTTLRVGTTRCGNDIPCSPQENEGCGFDVWCPCVELTAGTYYVTVETGIDDGDCDPYTFSVEECPPCVCQSGPDNACNLDGGLIGNNGTTDFPIEVTLPYHITDVNACLDITVPDAVDLVLELWSPASTMTPLAIHRGSYGENFTCTTFDDEALRPISAGYTPFHGSYIPEPPGLNVFDGEIAQGNWVLRVISNSSYGVSTLNWACLHFEYDYILPVELTSFDAFPGDRNVTLKWVTASEADNDRFEIERDGILVGAVPATNQPTGDRYQWIDTDVVNGVTYHYALVAVDLNGNREVLRTIEAVPGSESSLISDYALYPNYPNPFNAATTITYALPQATPVMLKVYDLTGREVALIDQGTEAAGLHSVVWQAADPSGKPLASGVYQIRLDTQSIKATQKLMLLR